jgi:hypothetical protein
MAAIAYDRHDGRIARRQALQLVTAPPSRRRPTEATYRRRRVVALVLALALAVAAVQGARSLLGASATAGAATVAPVVLVAEPGDSYWSLAATIHEAGDIRSVVDALVDANGGRELRAGDRIVLGR